MVNIKVRIRHLIQKHGTRNPEILANKLGIKIHKRPFTRIMGYFKKELGKKYIVVNSNLDETTQTIVIAHELGHALLHSSKNSYYLHEYTLFPRGKFEIEANKFAAELLVDEFELDKHYLQEMTIGQLACYYGVPEQFIIYKFNLKHTKMC